MLPRGGQQLIGRESGEIEGHFLLSEKQQQQIKPTKKVHLKRNKQTNLQLTTKCNVKPTDLKESS